MSSSSSLKQTGSGTVDSNGQQGKLNISGLKAILTLDTDVEEDKDLICTFEYNGKSKSTATAVNISKEPKWSDQISFEVKSLTVSTIKVSIFNGDPKKGVIFGTATIDVKDLIAKHGIFKNEQIQLTHEGKSSGTLTGTLEYKPTDVGEDEKIYQSRRFLGKVTLNALSAVLTAETDIIGKMDPYLILKLSDTTNQTEVYNNGGKEPSWKETYTFGLYSYQKSHILNITVMQKDSNTDDLVGEGSVDLKKLFDKGIVNAGSAIEEKVEIFLDKKSSGHVHLKLTSEANKELAGLIEQDLKKKQTEQAAKDKIKADEVAAKAKADEAAAAAKAKADDDASKSLKAEEESKVKQQNEEKARASEAERKKNEAELAATKAKEAADENQKQLDQTAASSQSARAEETSRLGGSKKQMTLSRIESQKLLEKNRKNGFGMSEFQSSNTLQNSVSSVSFPKELRFKSSDFSKPAAQYTILPSIFDNHRKGVIIGSSKRANYNISTNPGPGEYEVRPSLKKNGQSFGESREVCRNEIIPTKQDYFAAGNRSLENSMNRQAGPMTTKLPQIHRAKINLDNPLSRSLGGPSSGVAVNYHYSRYTQL